MEIRNYSKEGSRMAEWVNNGKMNELIRKAEEYFDNHNQGHKEREDDERRAIVYDEQFMIATRTRTEYLGYKFKIIERDNKQDVEYIGYEGDFR